MCMWCISGVCVPVMVQLSDKKQEELSDCAPLISNEMPVMENGQDEENISNLYSLLDDKVCVLYVLSEWLYICTVVLKSTHEALDL